jgi:hydroxymethylpyrimidine/phosphomethylpyrimidine kinase
MKKALTIAGSDSGGGAGIQADLKTFQAHDVYGASAITAVTAQNTLGVQAVALLDPALVGAQIAAVLGDIGADAVKTGMLGSSAIIAAVAEQLRRFAVRRLVVDPVMVAKGGAALLQPDALDTLCEQLIPQALLLTPNLPEAALLLGRTIATEDEMRAAVVDLHQLGPRYVLLKGGHLDGDPLDLLFDGRTISELRAERIPTIHTHGTGCTYAAAITARLARGWGVEAAVRSAHTYLQGAIRHATGLGGGIGPVYHGWQHARLKDKG